MYVCMGTSVTLLTLSLCYYNSYFTSEKNEIHQGEVVRLTVKWETLSQHMKYYDPCSNFMEFLDSCFLSIDKKIQRNTKGGIQRDELTGLGCCGNISRETA